ncbi:ATP-dependent RNA helicase DDX54-like isoform X2 [Haliotis asinina]|uniref:ATP-dependent RNA helicase DDX54-like isoform X2 n=1 Tax=Haliotis asinina TaxID=109174 RepID=UPI0035320D3F
MARHKQVRNKKKHTGKNRKGLHQKGKGDAKASSSHDEEVDSDPESDDLEVVSTNKNVKHENSDEEPDMDSDEEMAQTRKLVTQQNRKKKKSGGFQAMGLSYPVYKGVTRKGYKIPTPIQRKTIPLIMDGKDVVAMARTGSGKTAAFLIPMFEKLKAHSAKGARAMIMSPTRELALQTLKFTKELGKYTGLKAAVILGGDRMENQFAALHENPDIIIATPGRFLHVIVEMDMKLKSVEYIVFDEADRLFEMGFQEQLHEIIHRLPESRQTLLFSATLPKLLVEFAKAGLTDPTLIRLDVDSKLSENLKLSFLACRAVDKLPLLIYLLQSVIKAKEQTVIFAATKHHVEYLNMVLSKAGIPSSYIYSSLDQTYRKISVAKFQHKKVSVMIVTDLAARGIDIPMLDNVINFNFPAKSKLFVHRVGRVARAGRSGTAYSLIAPEEVPYLYDLHVFLGRAVRTVPKGKKITDDGWWFGEVPQRVIDGEAEMVRQLHDESVDLQNLKRVSENAYKHYVKSRPLPAQESVKRVKDVDKSGVKLGAHPCFANVKTGDESERLDLLDALRNYKSNTTIFEVNSTNKNPSFDVMKNKRSWHEKVVCRNRLKEANMRDADMDEEDEEEDQEGEEEANQEDVKNVFTTVIASSKQHSGRDTAQRRKGKKRKLIDIKDEENYLHYRPADYQSEKGLSVSSTFEQQASSAVLDLTGDDEAGIKKKNNQLKWDRKKKKFVREEQDPKKKKIKTESGTWISASYKSNAYPLWRDKHKIDSNPGDSDGEGQKSKSGRPGRLVVMGSKGRLWHTKGSEEASGTKKKKQFKELKSIDQIAKNRKQKSKLQNFQKHRREEKRKRRAFKNQKMKKQK